MNQLPWERNSQEWNRIQTDNTNPDEKVQAIQTSVASLLTGTSMECFFFNIPLPPAIRQNGVFDSYPKTRINNYSYLDSGFALIFQSVLTKVKQALDWKPGKDFKAWEAQIIREMFREEEKYMQGQKVTIIWFQEALKIFFQFSAELLEKITIFEKIQGLLPQKEQFSQDIKDIQGEINHNQVFWIFFIEKLVTRLLKYYHNEKYFWVVRSEKLENLYQTLVLMYVFVQKLSLYGREWKGNIAQSEALFSTYLYLVKRLQEAEQASISEASIIKEMCHIKISEGLIQKYGNDSVFYKMILDGEITYRLKFDWEEDATIHNTVLSREESLALLEIFFAGNGYLMRKNTLYLSHLWELFLLKKIDFLKRKKDIINFLEKKDFHGEMEHFILLVILLGIEWWKHLDSFEHEVIFGFSQKFLKTVGNDPECICNLSLLNEFTKSEILEIVMQDIKELEHILSSRENILQFQARKKNEKKMLRYIAYFPEGSSKRCAQHILTKIQAGENPEKEIATFEAEVGLGFILKFCDTQNISIDWEEGKRRFRNIIRLREMTIPGDTLFLWEFIKLPCEMQEAYFWFFQNSDLSLEVFRNACLWNLKIFWDAFYQLFGGWTNWESFSEALEIIMNQEKKAEETPRVLSFSEECREIYGEEFWKKVFQLQISESKRKELARVWMYMNGNFQQIYVRFLEKNIQHFQKKWFSEEVYVEHLERILTFLSSYRIYTLENPEKLFEFVFFGNVGKEKIDALYDFFEKYEIEGTFWDFISIVMRYLKNGDIKELEKIIKHGSDYQLQVREESSITQVATLNFREARKKLLNFWMTQIAGNGSHIKFTMTDTNGKFIFAILPYNRDSNINRYIIRSIIKRLWITREEWHNL